MADEVEERVKREMNWPKVLLYIYLNMSALYGLALIFTQARVITTLYTILLVTLGTIGVTTGCHRLWAHRTYTAVWPLRLALVSLHILACQGPVYDWVLDHRLHHKHFGMENDPYNHRRGMLYAHIGSRCLTSSPERGKLEKEIDMSDIDSDSIVMFERKFYWLIMPVFSLLLIVNAPVEYWGESILVSIFVTGFLRVTLLLHAGWLVNSANILWGLDPLDRKSIETSLVFFVNKSLWPQYHYLLPWDYQSGEYGTYNSGFLTMVIRVWAAMGLATRLQTITSAGVKKALAKATEANRPLLECLDEERKAIPLPDILNYME